MEGPDYSLERWAWPETMWTTQKAQMLWQVTSAIQWGGGGEERLDIWGEREKEGATEETNIRMDKNLEPIKSSSPKAFLSIGDTVEGGAGMRALLTTYFCSAGL